jgi:hypothetical protein
MELDRAYSNIGYNTNYGLAAVALVALKPIIKDFAKPPKKPKWEDDPGYHIKERQNRWFWGSDSADTIINSSDIQNIKEEVKKYLVKNSLIFDGYSTHPTPLDIFFHIEGDIHPGGIIHLVPQDDQSVKIIITSPNTSFSIVKDKEVYFQKILDGFKKEFEEGSI